MSLGEFLGSGSAITKGLYHLNGSSADSSGNANNGTDTTVAYGLAYGKFGQGAFFNNGDYSIANAAYVIPKGAKTISFWFKSSKTNDYQSVISNSYWDAADYGFSSYTAITTGKLVCLMRFTANKDVVSTINVCDGVLRHFVYTWDGSTDANKMILYINGVLNATNTSVSSETTNPGRGFRIGHYKTSIYYYPYFSIDEVIIENVAWSAAKVKKYYTMSKGRFGIL